MTENSELLKQLYEKVLVLATENAILIKKVLVLLQGDISSDDDTGLKGKVERHEQYIRKHEVLSPLDDVKGFIKTIEAMTAMKHDLEDILEHKEWVIEAAENAEKRSKLFWLGLTSILVNVIGFGFWLIQNLKGVIQ